MGAVKALCPRRVHDGSVRFDLVARSPLLRPGTVQPLVKVTPRLFSHPVVVQVGKLAEFLPRNAGLLGMNTNKGAWQQS